MIQLLIRLGIPIAVIIIAFYYNVWLGVGVILVIIGFNFLYSLGNFYAYIGKISYMRGEMEKAFKWMERAYKNPRSSVASKISYGYLLLKTGHLDKAEKVFNSMPYSQLKPDAKMLLKSNKALVHWKKGEIDEAVELLEEVNEKYKNTTNYGSLGYMYIVKGDLDKALQFNLEAYDYNDTDNIIQDNLGQTYYVCKEYEKSAEIYEKLIKTDPAFPEPYYYYGNVLVELGKVQEGLETLKKALKYNFSYLSSVTKEEVENRINELEKNTSGEK